MEIQSSAESKGGDVELSPPTPEQDPKHRALTFQFGINGYLSTDGDFPSSEFEPLFAAFTHLRSVVPSSNLRDTAPFDSHLIASVVSPSGLRLDGDYPDKLPPNPLSPDDVERHIASNKGPVRDLFVYMGYSLARTNYGAGDVRLLPFDGGSRATFGQFRLRTRLEGDVQKLDVCEYPQFYEQDL